MNKGFVGKISFISLLLLAVIVILIFVLPAFATLDPDEVTFVSPANNTYQKGTITLNVTSTADDINASSFYFSNTSDTYPIGTNESCGSKSCTISWITTDTIDGVYNVTADTTNETWDFGNVTVTNSNITIDNTPPVLNETTPVNNSYIYGTSSQLFQVRAYDINMNTSNVSLYYKQSTGESYWKVALTCYGSSSPFTCNTTVTLVGFGESVIQFYFEGTDNATNFASNGTVSSPLNTTIDRTPPTYSNEAKSVLSNTEYLPGRLYQFNLTWTDNNVISKVFIENNFTGSSTNTTVTTSEGNVYYYSFSDLGAGTYVYRWLANDSADNWNASFPSTVYVVVKNATNPVKLTINNSTVYDDQNVTITYGTSINASCSMVYPDSGTCSLYRNDTSLGTSETITLGAGTYAYIVNTSGNANYTENATGETFYLIVNPAAPDVKTFIDETTANETVTYPTSSTIKGNSTTTLTPPTFNLYVGGVSLTSGNPASSSILMGAGTHNVIYNTSDNANWTSANNNTLYLIVNQNNTNPVKLTINNSTVYDDQNVTITYGTSINASCSMVYPDSGTCSLYRNDTSLGTSETITLGAGTYAYIVNTSGNANYTENATGETFYLIVNKADSTSSLSLTIDGNSSSSQTRTYPNITMTNGSTSITGQSDLDYTLLRNETLIGTASPTANETIKLGAAAYNYTFNTSGGANYTAGQKEIILTMDKGSVSFNLTLNGTEGDKTYTYPQAVNATGWKSATDSESTYNITLWRNDTIVASNTTADVTTEEILLGNGTYNYTATFSSTNYSDTSIVNRYAYVNKGTPQLTLTASPAWTGNIYPVATTVTCAASSQNNEAPFNLYRNDTDVNSTENGIAITLGAAAYSYVCNTTETENYTTSTTSSTLAIGVNTSTSSFMNLTLNGTETNRTWFYPTAVNVTGWNDTSVFSDQNSITFTLYRNNGTTETTVGTGTITEEILLGNGTYNYTYYTAGNANYSSGSKIYYLFINKGDVPLHIAINGGETDQSFVYENYTNATGWSDVTGQDLSFTLWRDNTNISSGNSVEDVSRLGVTSYTYVFNTSGGANYSSNTTSRTLTITQKLINIYLALNGTQDVNYYTYPEAVNATAWKDSTTESTYNLSVWRNETIVASTTSEASTTEQILLGNGTYNYTVTLSSTNYTATAIVNRYAYVNKGDPTSYLGLFIDDAASDETIIYPATATVRGNVSTILGATDLSYTLWRDNTNITSGSDVSNSTRLGNATYIFNYNTTGGSNWTSGAATALTLYVNKGTVQPTLSISPSGWTQTYPTTTNVSCSVLSQDNEVTCSLWRNESSVSGTSENILWGAAAYLYKTNTSTTTNYTANSTGENQTLIISPGTPDVRTFIDDATSNKTITYETSATIKGNTSSTGVLPTFNLYISNINLGSGSSVSQPITMGYGTHNVVYNNTANANWTSASNSTLYLMVNQKNANVVLSPANGTITYEDSSSQYCTDSSTLNCVIYRNGTAITNDTTEYLPAGYWEFKANISDSANYTNWEVYQNVTVNPKNANVQVYPVTQTPFYPVTVTQYCTDNATLINCSIFRNDASISNNTDYSPGVGVYAYKANLTDQVNYTNYQDTETLTVQINSSTANFINLTINETETNQTYTYPTAVNASAWNDSSVFAGQAITFTLYRNNGTTETTIGTGNVEENILLGNGTYNYTYYTAGNANYSSASKNFWLFILKGPTSITLYLNGTPWTSNQIKEYPNATNINATINVSSQQSLVVLLRNGTPITNPNETLNDLGAWNYTAYYDQTENYSAASPIERILTIQDTTPPTILLYDYTNGTFKKAGDSLTLNISVSDNYKLSSGYNCSVYIGGTFADNITNTSAGWCNGTVTVPVGLSDGNNTLKINTTDYQGIAGSNTSYVVDIDNTNPIPAQPSELYPYTASTSVNITWTGSPGSDSGSGLNFYEVLISTDASTYTSVYNTSNSSIRTFTNSSLSDGSKYYWKVRTYDRVNNSNISSAVSTTIDITAPTVTINTPTSGSSYSIGDEVAVNATISDGGSGIDTNPLCAVKIGGTSVGSFYSSASAYCLGNVTIPSGLPSGSTEFNVTVSDKAGNAGSGNTTISISAGPQSIVITTPANNSYVNGTITIEASVSSLTNISRVEFFNGSTSIANVTSAPWRTTWNTANAADGTQNLKAIVYDKNGDSLNSSIIVVTVDNTNPTAASITYPTASLNLSGTFNITATGSDGVGISKIEFYDGDPAASGTLLGDDSTSPYVFVWTTDASNDDSHTIYARVIDKVNKYLDSSGVTFRIDNTASIASVTSITPNVTSGGIIYINGTVSIATSVSDSGSGIKRTELYIDGGNTSTNTSANPTFSLDTTGIDDGPHSLKIITYDYAGNLKESSPVNVSVSNLGPNSIVITTPANNTYVNDTLTIEAAAGENVYRVEFYNDTTTLIASDNSAPWQASWGTTGTSDDWHTLTAKAYDNVNNTLSSTVIRVRVDNTNPSASTLTYPTAGMNISGSITLQTTGTDAQGIAKIEFYDNNTLMGDDSTSPYTFVWTTNASNDGAHTLKARVIDNTGRYLDSSTVSVTVDNTKPIPSITSPTAGQDVNGSVTVTATITEGSLQKVDLHVDGAYAQTNSSPAATTTFNWNTNSVGDGSHMLSVRAYDYAGNYNDSAGVAVDVFNQAPLSVAITSPANNTYATGTITIVATASATVNISKVEFYNDSTTLIATDSDGSDGWSFSWNTAGAADGYHTLTAKAYDNVNNVRTSIAITIIVDNTAPTIISTSPSTQQNTRSVTIYATTNENAECRFATSSGTAYDSMTNTMSGTETIHQAFVLATNNVTNNYYVRCKDTAGNKNETDTLISFTVDAIAPTVTNTTPRLTDGYYTSAPTVQIKTDMPADCRWATNDANFTSMPSGNGFSVSAADIWTTLSGTSTSLINGTNHIYVRCRSQGQAIEMSSSALISFLYDDTNPSTPGLISPSNVTYTNDQTPTFTWGESTDYNGITKYYLEIDDDSSFGSINYGYSVTTTTYTPTSNIAAGTWYWRVIAQDNAGRNSSYNWYQLIIDTTSPSLTNPLPTTEQNSRSFLVSVNGGETGLTCKFDTSNVGYSAMANSMTDLGTSTYQSTLIVTADESYTVYFACRDTAGNTGTNNTGSFYVNATAPTVTASGPAMGYQTGSTVTLTATTDTNAYCRYDTTDKNFTQLGTQFSTTGETSHSTSVTPSSDGIVHYYVRCADSVGGINAMQSSILIAFIYDSTNPSTPSPTSPSNGTQVRTAPTLIWSASSDVNGIANYTLEIDDNSDFTSIAITRTGLTTTSYTLTSAEFTGLSDTTYYWRVRARDYANRESSNSSVAYFIKDTTAPSFTITYPSSNEWKSTTAFNVTTSSITESGGITAGTTCAVYYTDSGSTKHDLGTIVYDGSKCQGMVSIPSGAAEGSGILNVTIYDIAGNFGNATRTVQFDTTTPTASITDPTSGQTKNGTITITTSVSDGESGLQKVEFYVDGALNQTNSTPVATTTFTWGTTAVGDGSHSLKIIAYDYVGNKKESDSVNIIVDNGAPESIVITRPTINSYINGTVTIEASVTDSVAVQKVEFYNGSTLITNDTSAPWTASWNTAGVDGSQSLTAKVYDNVNNVLTSNAVIVTVDNTDPSTTVDYPTSVVYKQRGQALTIDYTYTETNPKSVKIEIFDGSNIIGSLTISSGLTGGASITRNDTVSIASDAADDTGYDVRVTITDEVSKTGTDTNADVVTIDSTNPTVSITSPTGGSYVNGTITVTLSVSDTGGSSLQKTELYIDGGLYQTNTTLPYDRFIWNTNTVPNGAHTLVARAYDNSGNTKDSSPVNVTVDNAAPQLAVIIKPAANSYVNGTITIEASVSDAISVQKVEFYNDSIAGANLIGTDTSETGGWVTTWNTANAVDGSHLLYARVYDQNNQYLDSNGVSITVDNTNPTAASITYPTASLNLSGTFNITATGSDAVGVSKIEFYDGDPAASGTLLGDDSTSPYSIVWATDASNDGSHTIYARVIDKVNKYLDSSGVTFRIDNTAPIASITSPTGGSYLNGTQTVQASVADAGSGLQKVEFYIDGGLKTTNSTPAATTTFTWDTTSTPDGAHSLTIIVYDYVGNTKTSSPVNITVDNVAPYSIVITTPANNTYVNDTLTIEATIGESISVKNVIFYNSSDGSTWTTISTDTAAPWTASWNTAGTTDGIKYLKARVTDQNNQILDSTAIMVRIDNTNPSASTLTYPTAGMNISVSITLQATGTDAQGIAKIEFYDNSTLLGDDSTSPYTYVWTTNASNDGAHILKARVIDNTGRHLDSSTVSVTVDNTKPIPSITSPTAGQDVNGSVTVTATITESGLQRVDLYVDGAYAQTNSSPAATTTFSWNTNSVGDGSHALSVRAYDYAGNYNDSAGVAVDVFNQAPLSVAITSPANNTYATGTITIVATASAVVNISKVEFYNDTTTLIATDSDGSDGWSTTWNTTRAADGYHTLTAKAYDNVNNVRTSIAITVLVDSNAPNAPTLYAPSSTDYITTHSVTWNWTAASDGSGSGIEKYQIQINDSTGIIKDDNTTSTSYTYYLADGAYSAHVRAIDKVGLISASWSSYQTIIVDTVVPQNLSVSINAGAEYTTSTSVNVTLYAEGAYGCRYRNENLAWSGWESYATSKAWTLSTGDGTKTVYYQCNDTAGNLADISLDTIILDTTAPGTPALVSPANETRTSDTTPTFRWDAVTDSTSGVASYNLIYSTSSDFSTGVTTVTSLTNTSYTPASALAVTTWYWKVNATDAAGNLGLYSQFFTFTIDNTSPIVTAVGPTGTLYTSSATLNATTDESATCRYSTSNVAYDSMGNSMTHVGSNVHQASLTGLTTGTYTYYFRCKDTAGNENTTTVYTTFSIDVQATVITSSSPSGFQNISAPNITIYTGTSAICRYDTIDKNFTQLSTQFSTTGSTMHTTNTSSSVQEGLNIYYVRCADDVNGTNAMQNSLLVIFTRDTSSPYISISAPNTTYINSQLVTFTISDSTSMVNISTITVTLTGAGTSSFTTSTCTENGQGGYYCSYTDSGITAGTTGLTVVATDRAGNTRTSTVAFTYDTSAPIITVTSPSSGALFNTKNVTLAMTTDESATCRYSTSNASYSLMGSTMNGAGSTSHSMLIIAVEGSNTYYFRCQDTAGNVNTTSASITFTIDSIAPSVTSFNPSLNTVVTSSITNITVVTSESATCRYNDTNSTSYAQLVSMSDLSTTHTKQLTGLLDKEYSYTIVCNDTVGNLGDVFMLTFKVDTRSLYNITRPDTLYGYWNANQWNSFLLPQIVLQNTTLANTAGTYNVTNVLASAAGNYTIIYYNPNDTSTTWTSYTPGVGGTLTTFNDQTGYRPYWIYINVTNERLEIN